MFIDLSLAGSICSVWSAARDLSLPAADRLCIERWCVAIRPAEDASCGFRDNLLLSGSLSVRRTAESLNLSVDSEYRRDRETLTIF